jgi:hypothetical protein
MTRIYIEQHNRWTSEGVETTYHVVAEGDQNQVLAITGNYHKAEQIFNRAVNSCQPMEKTVVKEAIVE